MKGKKISLLLIGLSLALTVAGLVLGDLDEAILIKAINLCYECIGIG